MSPRLAFLALVALEVAHTSAAILQHRAPATHDGFQYFTLQYFFLNNAIQGGGVAEWIPYMSHGTVATQWYGIQGSFLQQVLVWIGPLLRQADLLTLFHFGVFVDEMILLTGTWLLARRFFQLPATSFIALSVVGSCVWLDQPYWNFRLYYAIPLILDLGHRFLDTGKWRWFFLAANLLALQAVGNLPYFVPLTSFVVFLYFAWYAAANYAVIRDRVRSLRWGWPAVMASLGAAASLLLAFACLTIGTDQLVTYNPGRNPDGTTTLNGFLTYGGGFGVQKWLDLVLNTSPWFDMTLYAGVLVGPLALVGAFAVSRRRIHFVMLALTVLLFTHGTFVADAAFGLWPGMKHFRHIGLVTPLVKVLFCFVAGIGFEWLFDRRSERSPRAVRVAAAAAALVLVAGAWLAYDLSPRSGLLTYMDPASEPGIDRPDHMYEPRLIARRHRSAAVTALAGAVVVGLMPFVLTLGAFRPRAARLAALSAVLMFAAVDVYRFKFAHLVERSEVVPPSARFVTQAAPLTFPKRRSNDLLADMFSSPRFQATLGFNRTLLHYAKGRPARGTHYWSNHAFFFTDEAGSSFRMDSWLRPLDQLMRTAWGAPLDEQTLPPAIDLGRLRFPRERAGIARIAGVTADKIRFFTNAYSVPSAVELAPVVGASFQGNLLFVSPGDAAPGSPAPEPWRAQRSLSADESRQVPYEVLKFNAATLRIRAVNFDPAARWLSYADVWHPSWTATVNGKAVPVYRGNMAYKAIPIEEGENLIEFQFGSRIFSVVAGIAAINAAFWLCAVAAFAVSEDKARNHEHAKKGSF